MTHVQMPRPTAGALIFLGAAVLLATPSAARPAASAAAAAALRSARTQTLPAAAVPGSGAATAASLVTMAASTHLDTHPEGRPEAHPEGQSDRDTSAVEGDVRLVGEEAVANWRVGRLEVFFEGSWGQVCRANFDGPDADVACRQLGLGAGSVPPVAAAGRTAGAGNAALPARRGTAVGVTLPGCGGSEATLRECRGLRAGEDGSGSPGAAMSRGYGCLDAVGGGVMLACVVKPAPGAVEGAVRLVGVEERDGATAGVPEVFHAGAWGTFCSEDGAGGFPLDDASLSEDSAVVLCRQLGLAQGAWAALRGPSGAGALPPAWLSSVDCVGDEAAITDCGIREFGSASSCGATQRLVCAARPEVPAGTARLVGGREDPGGAWAYGRLEVFDGLAFSGIPAVPMAGAREPWPDRPGLAGSAAAVACRSLGFADGVQSPPQRGSRAADAEHEGSDGAARSISRVSCDGSEADLGSCLVEFSDEYNYGVFDQDSHFPNATLLCSSPTGCSVEAKAVPPAQGDVRLIPLADSPTPTPPSAPCDAVHHGVAQVFLNGDWVSICSSPAAAGSPGVHRIADTVCRQMGFPFACIAPPAGARYPGATLFDLYDYDDHADAGLPAVDDDAVLAAVACAGPEATLQECLSFFKPPQAEADANAAGNGKARAVMPDASTYASASCGSDALRGAALGVICRRFEIEEPSAFQH